MTLEQRENTSHPSLLILISILLCSCVNLSPPPPSVEAGEFLRKNNTDEDLINRFIHVNDISKEEAEQLSAYSNNSVRVLIARNPSTPEEILIKLADHSYWRIRAGVAGNPSTPLNTVLGLRTKGKWTLENSSISRNPKVPQEILADMYKQGETGDLGIAKNPNCPEEIMWRIYNDGGFMAHADLAANPNLPEELMDKLEGHEHRLVKARLSQNPSYKKHKQKNK